MFLRLARARPQPRPSSRELRTPDAPASSPRALLPGARAAAAERSNYIPPISDDLRRSPLGVGGSPERGGRPPSTLGRRPSGTVNRHASFRARARRFCRAVRETKLIASFHASLQTCQNRRELSRLLGARAGTPSWRTHTGGRDTPTAARNDASRLPGHRGGAARRTQMARGVRPTT